VRSLPLAPTVATQNGAGTCGKGAEGEQDERCRQLE